MLPELSVNGVSATPPLRRSHSDPFPKRGAWPPSQQLTHVRNFYSDTLDRRLAHLCARRIQHAWSNFRTHVRTTAARCLDSTRARVNYRADNMDRFPKREANYGREFYPSLIKAPRLQYPVWNPDTGTETFGTNKVCFTDAHFVALQPRDGAEAFTACRLQPYRSLFDRFPSLVFNTVVDASLMVAPNVGRDLFDFLASGKVLPLDAFAGICSDITHLHAMKERGGAYFRDLKPENICVSATPPHRLSIIDFQDTLLFGEELPFLHMGLKRGTDVYQTPGLVSGLYTGEVENRARYAEAADLYTLLLSIIAGTADTAWLRYEAGCNGRHHMKQARLPLPPGVMHPGNDAHFSPWIARHVYPAYWSDIRLLLTDPAQFARRRQTQGTLLQMLRFRARSQPPPMPTAPAAPLHRAPKRPHSA
jgi:hypothetical protein